VGNIFKLGTKFSGALKLEYVDEDGKHKPVIMGSYGIGPGRVLGTIVETHNDGNGIMWPAAVAPYQIHILSLGKDENIQIEAEKLYNQLQNSGYEVLWDDRLKVNPGAKFADADLIGCPVRITLSRKNLEKQQYEVKKRVDEKADFIPQNEIENYLKEQLA
jgi:prolyl-tRNA synthetase